MCSCCYRGLVRAERTRSEGGRRQLRMWGTRRSSATSGQRESRHGRHSIRNEHASNSEGQSVKSCQHFEHVQFWSITLGKCPQTRVANGQTYTDARTFKSREPGRRRNRGRRAWALWHAVRVSRKQLFGTRGINSTSLDLAHPSLSFSSAPRLRSRCLPAPVTQAWAGRTGDGTDTEMRRGRGFGRG